MPEVTKELVRKVVAYADFVGVNPKEVEGRLKDMQKNKRKIKGVWARSGWLWVAQEHDTKFTMFGVVFSPFVPSGEFGSWYVDDPQSVGARVVVQPEYRWKFKPDEIAKHRKMLEKVL